MKTTAALTLTLCLLPLALRAAEMPANSSMVIKELTVETAAGTPVDRGFILAHTDTRVGDELDRAAVSRDLKSLLDTGRFAQMDVRVEPLPDGIRLVYVAKTKVRLAEPLIISGAGELRESKIRDLMGLQRGDLISEHVLGTKAGAVRREYLKRRYPEVKLRFKIEDVDAAAGLVRVVMLIEEGPRAHVGGLRFTGNDHVPAEELERVFDLPSALNPLDWFKKKRYDREEIAEARLGVRDIYLDHGFLDVEVSPARVERDEEGNYVIAIDVTEGIKYRFGKVAVEGVTLFPAPEIHRHVTVLTGDTAARSEVGRTIQLIQDYYGSRGYLGSSVTPRLTPDLLRGSVDVHFQVREGALTRVRNIIIRGNTRTRDKVIRRELLVEPGDVYDAVRVRRSERIVQNLGFFSTVRSHTKPTALDDQRDLQFEVEEKRTGNVMLGAGFSSVDNLIGFLELTQGNFDLTGWPYFTGGGQKLKLRAQFGSTRSDYQLSFTEPWFLDRKLSLGTDIFRNEVSYDDYDVKRTGFSVGVGKALPFGNRLDTRYRLERAEIRDVADTNEYFYVDNPEEPYVFDSEEDTIKSSIRLSLTHDSRNNPFVPTRGTRITTFGSLAGGPLGFDTDIYALGIRAKQYLPLWFGHTVSLFGRAEIVENYGDTDEVPLADRLFIGGGRTIRGFEYRDVGPKVFRIDNGLVDTRAVGGESLAMASVEYTAPVIQGIRWALFYDMGNVWREAYDFDFGSYASAWGTGVRLDMPGFPIRIDYAWALEKDSELTQEDRWTIWIGYDY